VPKVAKDVPSRAIVAGNPAKIIRKIKLSFQSVEFIESIELKAKECRIAKREHP
jgi:serine acetyltransferase